MYLDLTDCFSVGFCQGRSLIRLKNLEIILRKIKGKSTHNFHQNETTGVYNEERKRGEY